MKKNIVLIGMPGCGKSTVGRIIAKKTGLKFIDTDAEIALSENMSIPDIISRRGEEAFREIEHREIKKAVKNTGCVIATGGGAVTYPKNYEPLHENSLVFFLDRSINELPLKNRPISQRDGIKELYKKRKPLYLSWKTPGCLIKCPPSPGFTAEIIIRIAKKKSSK